MPPSHAGPVQCSAAQCCLDKLLSEGLGCSPVHAWLCSSGLFTT